MRVQIAVDAARGLEYIHEHTKPHYVHRDIKTSNILLDSAFRAKVSLFSIVIFFIRHLSSVEESDFLTFLSFRFRILA